VDASDLLGAAALAEYTELNDVLHRATQFEEALMLDHIVRLGRQTAYERVAHLLVELNDRLQTVGLSDGRVFEVPLTQEVMADTLGLSVVHINRTLQQLRRERMIVFEAGRIDLLFPDLMAAAADYSPWRATGS
jgi:CRP-like cAMP-binding protein